MEELFTERNKLRDASARDVLGSDICRGVRLSIDSSYCSFPALQGHPVNLDHLSVFNEGVWLLFSTVHILLIDIGQIVGKRNPFDGCALRSHIGEGERYTWQ